jgi:hypothetical protein
LVFKTLFQWRVFWRPLNISSWQTLQVSAPTYCEGVGSGAGLSAVSLVATGVVTCELAGPAIKNVVISTASESRLKLSKKFMALILDKT